MNYLVHIPGHAGIVIKLPHTGISFGQRGRSTTFLDGRSGKRSVDRRVHTALAFFNGQIDIDTVGDFWVHRRHRVGRVGTGTLIGPAVQTINLVDSATTSRHTGRLLQVAHKFSAFVQLGTVVTGNARLFADIFDFFHRFLVYNKKKKPDEINKALK